MAAPEQGFSKLGIKIPDIMLPRAGTDMSRWAVIACDQYTSETEYWEQVRQFTGDAPSTVHLILPEAFLGSSRLPESITGIHDTMRSYLDSGILTEYEHTFVLVERKTAYGRVRHGLILAVDLEYYDYAEKSESLIRPTEGTILSRIPPREKIRFHAPLELPHILVLMADPENRVLGPLIGQKETLPLLYDFELMQNSGRLRGYRIHEKSAFESIAAAFGSLIVPGEERPLLLAVGDGNHSLAAARSVWNRIKSEQPAAAGSNHPARYALVEIVNIFDSGLQFEPIHRVLFNTAFDKFMSFLKDHCDVRFIEAEPGLPLPAVPQSAGIRAPGITGRLEFLSSPFPIVCATLQDAVDSFLEENKEAEVDYVHGAETAENLGKRTGNIALFLPPLDKHAFFDTIKAMGTLPRKAFSMGEASEKRFYVECRKITV